MHLDFPPTTNSGLLAHWILASASALFGDGVSEAMNAAEEEWGEERLIETVKGCLGLPPAEAIARIMQTADAFVAGARQNDDMTIVALYAQLPHDK